MAKKRTNIYILALFGSVVVVCLLLFPDVFLDGNSYTAKTTSQPRWPPGNAVDMSSTGDSLSVEAMPLVRNVEDQRQLYISHHPIFSEYVRMGLPKAPFDPDYLFEFVGVHTSYEYDCKNYKRYRVHHLARGVPCEDHDRLIKQQQQLQLQQQQQPLFGFFPVADEEYFQWIDCLTSAYWAARDNRHYTFIELGARYGTWAARAAAAFRLLAPGKPFTVVGIEGDAIGFKWMEDHFKKNNLGPNGIAIQAFVTSKESANEGGVQARCGWEGPQNSCARMSLLEIMAPYTTIDELDFDIQGYELSACNDNETMLEMKKKVRLVHFGTHSSSIEKMLIPLFVSHGWRQRFYFPGTFASHLTDNSLVQTPYGRMHMNDGILSFFNPDLVPAESGLRLGERSV